jgi:exodeoxyribonuclease V alpha subunit
MGVAAAPGPEPALRALGALRVLCALNLGKWGVGGLNARIQARLQHEGLGAHSRPVLVTVNDPASGLFNGDLGVVLASGRACFGSPERPRSIPEASLPQHQTAWAMTVHRSQGSEYACILLVLPDAAHELVGPELLYTAVTRAKERVILVAEIDVLQAGVKEREKRVTSF